MPCTDRMTFRAGSAAHEHPPTPRLNLEGPSFVGKDDG